MTPVGVHHEDSGSARQVPEVFDEGENFDDLNLVISCA